MFDRNIIYLENNLIRTVTFHVEIMILQIGVLTSFLDTDPSQFVNHCIGIYGVSTAPLPAKILPLRLFAVPATQKDCKILLFTTFLIRYILYLAILLAHFVKANIFLRARDQRGWMLQKKHVKNRRTSV